MDKPIKAEKLLFTGGEILDLSAKKRERVNFTVVDGKIDKIGVEKHASFQGEVIDISGNLVVPGLMDMHVHLREPGREDEETVASGCAAAMAGGLTAVCAMPNTDPACDKQEVVRFLKKQAEAELVEVFPIAAVTKKRVGAEITEMAELIRAGAVAFSDDGSPVANSAVMRRALEYSGMYQVPIIDHCEDPYLFAGGQMNESVMSTRLGLTGIPNAAEEIMIARDIALLRLCGGHVHIAHISTAGGVELVRRAKAEGLPITCEVTPHHLAFTDEVLANFDTNLKMNPPLRTTHDVASLHDGLRDGTIDVIASDHAPHSVEEKDVEFMAAPFGIIGLETMLGVILSKLVEPGILALVEALAKMSLAPRSILRLPLPRIKEGELANLTIFAADKSWRVEADKIKSLSRNTPFAGWELPGKVFAVLNNHLYWQM